MLDKGQNQTSGDNCINIQIDTVNYVSTDKDVKDTALFSVKHLLCKSFDVIEEILEEKLENIPVSNAKLLKNNIYNFWKSIIIKDNTSCFTYYGAAAFSSKDAIFQKYPNCVDLSTDTKSEYPNYDIQRPLQDKDISNCKNVLFKKILQQNHSANSLGKVKYYIEYCGTCNEFVEKFILRKLSFLFVSIENISNKNLYLSNLQIVKNEGSSFHLLNFSEISNDESTINLPQICFKPGESIIIPQATLFEPTEGYFPESCSCEVIKDEMPYSITSSHIIDDNNIHIKENCQVLGPYNFVKSFVYKENAILNKLDIHSFDFSNLFIIDHQWSCGSCPHIILRNFNSGRWEYFNQTFHKSPIVDQYIYEIPKDIDKIRIIEIEDEKTYINQLEISDLEKLNSIKKENIILNKGEFLEINLKKDFNYTLIIKGYYIPLNATSKSPEANLYRQNIVNMELKRINNL